MKKIMNWLANSFAPKMNKFCSRPWISGVSSGMQKIIPFILTGCVIFFYNVLRSWVPSLPDLGFIINYSFGLLGIIVAFSIAQQCMEKIGIVESATQCGITAICVFFMLVNPITGESGETIIQSGRLGASGMIVGIVAAIGTAIVFNLFAKLKFLKDSDIIPDFVVGWLNVVVPALISLSISMILTSYLKIDIYSMILSLFAPLSSFAQSLPGLVVIVFIPVFMSSLGINGWLFAAISTPIYMAGIQENIANVAAGLPAMNITTNEVVFTSGLIAMGGLGATLVLNILMFRAKSKKLRVLSRIFIGPSIFNINEPVIYGVPIVLNPILMIPLYLCTIIGCVITWGIMRLGWLNIPASLLFTGQLPVPFSTVIATGGDFRGVLWAIVLFVIYIIIWYPFFKIYDNQCLHEEKEQEEIN
ncbi:MAG: PTS sugar transporter subunit IIC [Coprobacillus sp.]|nr:PTS sugar transporter subunit IIC [Coprobacillus sp.]